MSHPSLSRPREGTCPPANPQTYREAELSAALVADALFFLRHRDRFHRVRKATKAEIRVVQVIEHRLKTPSPGCEAVVVVRRVDDNHRRRVVIEAAGLDLDTMGEAEAAALYADVVDHGRVRFARDRS